MTLVNAETGEIVQTLEACEQIIERGLGTFVEVGDALLTIRDAKLYRQDYDTFEGYCIDRWNLSRKRAYDLAAAAEVVGTLSPIGDTPLPANEAQARALAPLRDDPAAMADAMRAASERTNGKPTAKAVSDAVAEQTAKLTPKGPLTYTDDERAELAEAAAAAGLDTAPGWEERARQQGEFGRLCRDLAALPSPDQFVDRYRTQLPDDYVSGAHAAHEWLSGFLARWEAA